MSGMNEAADAHRRKVEDENRKRDEAMRTAQRKAQDRRQALDESLVVLAHLLSNAGIPTIQQSSVVQVKTSNERTKGGWLGGKRVVVPAKYKWQPVSYPCWLLAKVRGHDVLLKPDGTAGFATDEKYDQTKAEGILRLLGEHELTWPDDAPDLTEHFDLT